MALLFTQQFPFGGCLVFFRHSRPLCRRLSLCSRGPPASGEGSDAPGFVFGTITNVNIGKCKAKWELAMASHMQISLD